MRLPVMLGISALVGASVACMVQQAGPQSASIAAMHEPPRRIEPMAPAAQRSDDPRPAAWSLSFKSEASGTPPTEPVKASPAPDQPGEATSTEAALPI